MVCAAMALLAAILGGTVGVLLMFAAFLAFVDAVVPTSGRHVERGPRALPPPAAPAPLCVAPASARAEAARDPGTTAPAWVALAERRELGVLEIPLESICGTVEELKAARFDSRFPPRPLSRRALGPGCGSPRRPVPCCRRSRCTASRAGTTCATATTGSRWHAISARRRSRRRSSTSGAGPPGLAGAPAVSRRDRPVRSYPQNPPEGRHRADCAAIRLTARSTKPPAGPNRRSRPAEDQSPSMSSTTRSSGRCRRERTRRRSRRSFRTGESRCRRTAAGSAARRESRRR